MGWKAVSIWREVGVARKGGYKCEYKLCEGLCSKVVGVGVVDDDGGGGLFGNHFKVFSKRATDTVGLE